MKVYFIGAGPGAADLITVRGVEILKKCPVLLYAGSLVPKDLLCYAPLDAKIRDTASMTLNEVMDEIAVAQQKNQDVARLHSGDPSLYGATAEQMRRLDKMGILYHTVPGVSAYAAAAAALNTELTLPGIAQSLIITRTAVRASSMPEKETLDILGQSRTSMAIHLSINNLARVTRDLIPLYGARCPVIIACCVSTPDEKFLFGQLDNIRKKVKEHKITRTALIMVGHVFGNENFQNSRLYAEDHSHLLRKAKKPLHEKNHSD